MKKKLLGILVIITMLVILPITIFSYSGIDTNITIGGSDAASSSVAMTNRIVGTLQTAGTIISVIALIIIGMRYMFSSIEEKAQMKGVLGYYIAGCVLVFATSNVLAFAYDIINDVQHLYVDVGVVKNATCVDTGEMKRKCTGTGGLCNCSEANPKVITVSIPPLGHNEVANEYIAPKCNSYGYEGGTKCTRCRKCCKIIKTNRKIAA